MLDVYQHAFGNPSSSHAAGARQRHSWKPAEGHRPASVCASFHLFHLRRHRSGQPRHHCGGGVLGRHTNRHVCSRTQRGGQGVASMESKGVEAVHVRHMPSEKWTWPICVRCSQTSPKRWCLDARQQRSWCDDRLEAVRQLCRAHGALFHSDTPNDGALPHGPFRGGHRFSYVQRPQISRPGKVPDSCGTNPTCASTA